MGNSSSSATKINKPLPIETTFRLPSPIPTWPSDEGFASGSIDLGGLKVCQISSFTKVWATYKGGQENLGATFFEPTSIPEGFHIFGYIAQPNNKLLYGWALAGKDVITDCPSGQGALKQPIDYTLVWSSESLKINQDGIGYIWLPTPPDGYKAIGHVVTTIPQKPSLDKVRCVRSDFADVSENDAWIWGFNGFSVHASRPATRGIQALGVPAGTFITQNGGVGLMSLACLKNANANFSAMPNESQIQALVQAYSPLVHFHPDEKYLPSSVSWFFQNGALLYTKGQESNPVPIDPTGSNLPQGGSNDGAYWLDLPADKSERERVKRGGLEEASVYLHIKPVLGATFTDIAVWFFCPFNGAARAKVQLMNVISLGKIGQHVGDWEHLTLRISNFNGELRSVYFSQHSKGKWVNSPDLEFQNGTNKPVAYASLHGHAFYAKAGLVLQGNARGIGIRNDCGKSSVVMDTGPRSVVVAAEHLGSALVEPPWLNYAREWGPKISYNIADELRKVKNKLPVRKMKTLFQKIVESLPNEIFEETGPTGPKWKDYWIGDERV